MKYLLNLTIILTAAVVLLGIGWVGKELILAELPTPVIVAGCLGCILIAAAVVLAALQGVKTTNTKQS